MPAAQKATLAPGPALLRWLKILQSVFFTYSLLLVYAARLIPRQATEPDASFNNGIAFVAALFVLGVILLRLYLVRPLLERLRQEGDQPDLLARLRKFHILSAVLTEAVMLYGFVLYVMGAPLQLAAIFGAIGLILQIVFWPRGWAPAN